MHRIFFIFFLLASESFAQQPFIHYTEAVELRYHSRQPVIHYTLRIDTAGQSLSVEMKLRNVPDSFRVAMFAHPEYDDRYWRFIRDLSVENSSGKGRITRLEDALWVVHTTDGEAIIRYRFILPGSQEYRGSWRPFLSATGALIGGPQAYLYVVGAELAPSYVHLQIPKDWEIATGLQRTANPLSFFAPAISTLVDCPFLVGKLKSWSFAVDGVPHLVSYWPAQDTVSFDTSKLVMGIQRFVEQAALLFGRLPYRDYHFLLQDASYGGLEHNNSVTLGASAKQLTGQMDDFFRELAHEYFHTWNLMRIRPSEYGDVSYKKIPLSKGLWWSEGLTMFYADLLLRRAGMDTTPRTDHLAELIRRYYSNPAHYEISAEKLSMASYAPPGFLGNYDGSTHLQGEVLGTILDLIIRNATNGSKSMDDVMRRMMERFAGQKGFRSSDIEAVIAETCGCSVKQFFDDHIRGNKKLDLSKWLALAGLSLKLDWKEARDREGMPQTDFRVYAWQETDSTPALIGLMHPHGEWAKAGLRTGDQLVSVNGKTITVPRDFYGIIRNSKMGDKLNMVVLRKKTSIQTTVVMSGFKEPEVQLSELPNRNEKQKRLMEK